MKFSCSSCYSLPSNILFSNLNFRLRGYQNVTKVQHIYKITALSKWTVSRAIERDVIKQILELVTFDLRRVRDRLIITSKCGS
jgi:hypothetical protein